MKRMTAFFMVLCLALGLYLPCMAEGYALGVIDGGDADRVHLRELPSTSSPSRGLYFTGTEVGCGETEGDWTFVTIGTQAGYIMSKFIRQSGSVAPLQPIGVANGDVFMRYEDADTSGVMMTLGTGTTVTVLGETANRWYCVRYQGQTGYLPEADLTLTSETQPATGAVVTGYDMVTYAPTASISIQYPQFTGTGVEPLNRLVVARAQGLGATEPGESLTASCQAAVTLMNSKVVSIVLWGEGNLAGSAHPFTMLEPMTIALDTMEEIGLTTLYDVKGDFAETYFAKAYFPTEPITSYDAESFPQMLSLVQESNATVSDFDYDMVSFFLKPTGLVLSFPAIHATGSDHFEGEISYADAAPWYRLTTPIWTD